MHILIEYQNANALNRNRIIIVRYIAINDRYKFRRICHIIMSTNANFPYFYILLDK